MVIIMSNFSIGNTVFFIESHYIVNCGIVRKCFGNRYIVETVSGALTLQSSRLFNTESEAEKKIVLTGRQPSYAYDRIKPELFSSAEDAFTSMSAAAIFGQKKVDKEREY